MREEEQPLAAGSRLADVDIGGIMRLIPHRYPFLLVDRVIELHAFQRAVGIKNVTINEPFFRGHFPSEPIMPGVLLVETMAQTAAVLAVAGLGPAHEGRPVYFMGIEGARFRRPVRPGDQLRAEITVLRNRLGVWKFGARVTVDGELTAEAGFSAKIVTG
jgi:3-hydroxyacyl-[acyl-carrier-protein] dehydratase